MFGGFGGNQNNSGTPSINTKIRTMYGDSACMQLSYWNDNISIRINPIMGVNAQGIRQYDYNRRGSTALTPEKCLALAEEIERKIIPEIEKVKKSNKLEKPINVGVGVGNKGSAFYVEYKNDEKGVPYLYVTLYTNIEENKAPKEGAYSYKFSKTIVVDNYDPDNGTGNESTVESEFVYFYKKIKSIPDVQGSAAHSANMDITNKQNTNTQNYSGPMQANQTQFNQPQQNNYTAPMGNFSSEGFPF